MDYFEWFGIDRKFTLDQGQLRKSFLVKSMNLHPDKAANNIEAIPELSGYNNLAYSTLKDEKKRFTYLLNLEKIISPDEKPILPQEFLMEMLEFNIEIEDAKDSKDETKILTLKEQLTDKIDKEFSGIQDIINQYDNGIISEENRLKLKNYYFIRKYLLRIEESIYTFASH